MKLIPTIVTSLALFIALSIANRCEAQLGNLFGKPATKPFAQVDEAAMGIKRVGELGLPIREEAGFKLPSLGSLFGRDESKSIEGILGARQLPQGLLPQAKSQPNFLDQLNAKSKAAIDRTTEWAREKQQQLQQKSFQGLQQSGAGGLLQAPGNRMVEGMKNFFGGLNRSQTTPLEKPPVQPRALADRGNARPPSAAPATSTPSRALNYYGSGAQPPIRSAAVPSGQTTQRF